MLTMGQSHPRKRKAEVPDEQLPMPPAAGWKMPAKYGGQCRKCLMRFRAGTMIIWLEQNGAGPGRARHVDCNDPGPPPVFPKAPPVPANEVTSAVRTTRDIAAAAKRLGMHPKGLERRLAFDRARGRG